MKKWQEAFDEFNYSWNINEGEPVAQEGLKKTLKECFSEIEKWTKEKPADPFAHYYLAYALCFKDKPKKAMEEIEKAIELDKSKAQFYDAKGYFLYWQENYKESIEAYKECIAKDPSYWRAYNMISKNYLGKKELKEALDIMLKAVNINPNIISIQTNLADVYAKIDDFERAIIANKKAISLEAMFYGRPKDPITQLNLAVCYFNLKNYEMAWRYARIAERMGFLDAKKVIKELKRVSKEPE
jgi:tetratricopeptide (TPR) repeat protein